MNKTITITFPTTIYGAEWDVVSGSLKVTDGYIASYNGETLPSTWISDRDEYASGTTPTIGAEVVYKLATPTTINLSPLSIRMLEGTNNIYADCGEVIEGEYFVGEGGDIMNYSTAEKHIGKWVDGSDLYQITLYTNTQVSLNNSNWTTIPWVNEPSNIAYLVSAVISRQSPNTNMTMRFALDDGHIKGAALSSDYYPVLAGMTEYLTIQYTKSN